MPECQLPSPGQLSVLPTWRPLPFPIALGWFSSSEPQSLSRRTKRPSPHVRLEDAGVSRAAQHLVTCHLTLSLAGATALGNFTDVALPRTDRGDLCGHRPCQKMCTDPVALCIPAACTMVPG